MTDVSRGEMLLYDFIRPPLLDGEYRAEVSTDVRIDGTAQSLPHRFAYFNVEGPRFSLAPAEVSAVFPPRNGHGAFHSALPHVALGRRTLPWERTIDAAHEQSADGTPFPWLALLLLEEGEYTLETNVSLESVVGRTTFAALGSPAGIHCDAVEADVDLLRAVLPLPAELPLLTHVRQVNTLDRELAAGDSDGFFAVVMANRLPREGAKHRAFLVSLEARASLLPTSDVVSPVRDAEAAVIAGILLETNRSSTARKSADASRASVADAFPTDALGHGIVASRRAKLVVLHSWSFECTEGGTFRELMQDVNVGIIGDVAASDGLKPTETGHIPISVTNRDGAAERAFYRGPLVGAPLSRDPSGPYHSADQARRLAPDTASEDISYASAFEVGRLLAAADARLAQELMRWRRGAYRQSARNDAMTRLRTRLRLPDLIDTRVPLAALFATNAIERIAVGAGPLVDPFGLAIIESSPLLASALVRETFALESDAQVAQLLGQSSGAFEAHIAPSTKVAALLGSLEAVLADSAGLRDLGAAREGIVRNAADQIAAERRSR